jgi:hypothetical protein
LFSGLVRGMSDPREGSKILTFLFRSRLVCSLLLHLQSLGKGRTANFTLTEFSEVPSQELHLSGHFLATFSANGYKVGPFVINCCG